MKKQQIIFGIIILIITVGLSGCNEKNDDNNNIIDNENETMTDEDKLIGTWIFSGKYNNSTLIASYFFSSDKRIQVNTTYNDMIITMNGTWNISDNKLIIVLSGGEKTITDDYKFSNNNTKLILTESSGKIVIFTKQ